MPTTIIGLILTLSAAVLAADKTHLLNVRPGLWEISAIKTRKSGMPSLSADDFPSNLLPEERVRLGAESRASSQPNTESETYQICVTPEKLDVGSAFMERVHHPAVPALSDDQQKALALVIRPAVENMATQLGCTVTVVTSTGSKMELRSACEKMGLVGVRQLEALSREAVKGSSDTRLVVDGELMTEHIFTFTGKWIGPVCDEIRLDALGGGTQPAR
jgi:Protein of unknown function (DUF3617)